MSNNAPSTENSRNKWRSFKRTEAAMWHASRIYQGTGDAKAALKAAEQIRQFFDDAYEEAKVIADADTAFRAEQRARKDALKLPDRPTIRLPQTKGAA